jgi:hypothetical protein
MYVGPQVGSLVDLQLEPRRCQERRVAVPGSASESSYEVRSTGRLSGRIPMPAIK